MIKFDFPLMDVTDKFPLIGVINPVIIQKFPLIGVIKLQGTKVSVL